MVLELIILRSMETFKKFCNFHFLSVCHDSYIFILNVYAKFLVGTRPLLRLVRGLMGGFEKIKYCLWGESLRRCITKFFNSRLISAAVLALLFFYFVEHKFRFTLGHSLFNISCEIFFCLL